MLDTEASWLIVTTKFVNTSTTDTMHQIYYLVSGDPDNDEALNCIPGESGSFPTNNHIAYQGGPGDRHEVWARPPSAHQDAFSGLATKDCRAKALIYQAWPPGTGTGNELDLVWAGTATGMGTLYYGLQQSTLVQDIAYGLIFKLGDLKPGDSTMLSFAWIFSDTLAIDSAFTGPLGLVTQGTLHPGPAPDSVFLCGLAGCGVSGKTFTADILDGDTKNWTYSKWTWAPSTGLSATTGTHVVVDFAALSGPTTYTITGVQDTAHGMCSTPVVYYLYAQPCFNATSNSSGALVNVGGVWTPQIICMNETLTLQAHGDSTGATYYWYGPAGYTAFTQYASRTGLTMADTGIYYVVRSQGGVNDTAATRVLLKALPVVTATSNGPVCSGNPNTLLLFANPDSTGETFNWTGPNGFSSVLQNPTLPNPPVVNSGVYKVVTHWNGCNDSNTVTVVIDSTPAVPTITGNSPLCSSHTQGPDTLKLHATDVSPGALYSWAGPAGFTSPSQNPTIPNVHVPASGVYTVTAYVPYDGLTCSNTNTYTVVVDSTPYQPTLGSNAPICSGNALLLTSTSTDLTPTFTTNYRWTGPNAFTSLLQNPTISPASTFATGIYSVTATIAYAGIVGGCTSDTATMIVVVDSTPQAPHVTSNSPAPPGICQGDTLKLYSSDSTALVSYSWAGPAGFSSTLQNPFITPVGPAATGTYTVTAILGMCSTPAVTTVTITPTPIVVATNNGPICTGVTDTLFLQASSNPGTTFVWSGPYTFVSSAQNPFRTPAIHEYSGIYQVVAYLNGCPSLTTNDTVTINQTPPAPWISWLTFCQGYDATRLQAFGDSIRWYPSSAPGVAGTMVAPIPPTAHDTTMWFYVTQTKMKCESAVDSFKVTINPKPTVTVSPSIALCPHDTTVFTAVDNDAIAYYHWAPAMYLSDTVGPSVIVRPETNVTYTVVATNKYDCTDTADVTVTVRPGALLTINTGDSVILYPGETYQIDPMTNCLSFEWFPPAGLNNWQIPNPVASPEISTKYTVKGTTSWGCIAEDSLNIYVSEESLLALPNAFTPGSGPNNTFKIIKRGLATLRYFRVFDRWGVKVFETTDIDKGWDGTYNGTMQPYGVYVYEVAAVTSAGRSFEKHGNVTLIK
jgi:gliding motility-associated-like protein